jgi:hypothetical protein
MTDDEQKDTLIVVARYISKERRWKAIPYVYVSISVSYTYVDNKMSSLVQI